MKGGWVYILASKRMGTLYTGVTSDISRRVYDHKTKAVRGFTAKYGVDRLVYYERFERIEDAISYEKRIKNWKRDWKIALIERENPEWDDLYLSHQF
ncbi:MAG: GIY-YIG nuclease family protein [Parvularculaceae bacterium]